MQNLDRYVGVYYTDDEQSYSSIIRSKNIRSSKVRLFIGHYIKFTDNAADAKQFTNDDVYETYCVLEVNWDRVSKIP